ncbi:uncharacterized protein PG998_015124 [Apiospora kogelbergensis]|uniref:uncharacterized protein n=1 Tax=Apiospora kogelbergensis TaxID=1337665 RepID=UPI0031317767
MDSRQLQQQQQQPHHHQQSIPPHPQHHQQQPPPISVPFARNAAASPPYGRSPFPHGPNPATTTPSPYPPASHPQAHPPPTSPAGSATGAYEHQHQRHPSDPSFFAHQAARPSYAPDHPSHPPHTHSRHPSTSSLGGHPSQMPPAGHPMSHYGHPSASRGPPVNLGPPSAFPAGRELPALNSIPRTGNAGGSMSISAMLGGAAAHRESTPGHPHTAFPPPSTSAAAPGPGPAYASSVHASPRMQNATEYNGYVRGPQTPPEHVRPYDARDQRGSVAGSPPQAMYGTPEVARFGTPQAYPQRGPPMGPGDDRRDPSGRMAAASVPPRPSSQPRAYSGMPGRPVEMGRGPPPQPQPQPGEPMYGRREEMRPGQQEYNPERQPRPLSYEEQRRLMDRDREMREQMDREAEYRERERMERARFEEQQRGPFMAERERMERDRMERDRMERERELDMMREHGMRERTSSDPSRSHGQRPVDYGPPGPNGQGPPQGPPPYGRMDPREAAAWQQQQQQQQQQQRPGFDQPPRGHYDQQFPGQRPNEYPVTNGPVYDRYPAHAQPPWTDIPLAAPHHKGCPCLSRANQGRLSRTTPRDRHRYSQMPPHPQHPQQQQPPPHQHRPRPNEEGPPPPSIAYNGGTGTLLYEPSRQPRSMDDGAAPPLMRQHSSNGLLAIGEINRKGAHLPLAPGGPPEPPVKAVRKRNRKAKDIDGKGDDDDSTGRNTPVGRAKRPKTHAHHHHHQYPPSPSPPWVGEDELSTPCRQPPLKNFKSTTPIPSPTGLAKDFALTHSHQIPRSNGAPTSAPKQASTTPVIVPKTKRSVNSQAVLESVAHKPRKHLGDVVYDASLTPAKLSSPSRFGFASTPRPLPMAMIRDNENSTLTVKIPRAHLTTVAREEITTRRAIWGTDVYSDDSDVVAACIHAGWIRGEWSNDIDTDLLDLRVQPPKSKGRNAAVAPEQGPQEVLTSPPATGPVQVPHHRDLHVTILILPALEKYTSTTRFGIQSREFGGTYNGRKSNHDGISFMVTAIRWVDGAAPQSRLRGKARRERIRKAMGEVQRAHVLDIGDAKTKKPASSTTAPTTKTVSLDGDKENHPAANGVNGSNGVNAKASPAHSMEKDSGDVGEPSNEEGPAKVVENMPVVETVQAL